MFKPLDFFQFCRRPGEQHDRPLGRYEASALRPPQRLRGRRPSPYLQTFTGPPQVRGAGSSHPALCAQGPHRTPPGPGAGGGRGRAAPRDQGQQPPPPCPGERRCRRAAPQTGLRRHGVIVTGHLSGRFAYCYYFLIGKMQFSSAIFINFKKCCGVLLRPGLGGGEGVRGMPGPSSEPLTSLGGGC